VESVLVVCVFFGLTQVLRQGTVGAVEVPTYLTLRCDGGFGWMYAALGQLDGWLARGTYLRARHGE